MTLNAGTCDSQLLRKKLMTPGLSPCLFSCPELHMLALFPSPRSVSLIWPQSDFISPFCSPPEQWTCNLILSAPQAEQPSSPARDHLSHPGAVLVLARPSLCISDNPSLILQNPHPHGDACGFPWTTWLTHFLYLLHLWRSTSGRNAVSLGLFHVI